MGLGNATGMKAQQIIRYTNTGTLDGVFWVPATYGLTVEYVQLDWVKVILGAGQELVLGAANAAGTALDTALFQTASSGFYNLGGRIFKDAKRIPYIQINTSGTYSIEAQFTNWFSNSRFQNTFDKSIKLSGDNETTRSTIATLPASDMKDLIITRAELDKVESGGTLAIAYDTDGAGTSELQVLHKTDAGCTQFEFDGGLRIPRPASGTRYVTLRAAHPDTASDNNMYGNIRCHKVPSLRPFL